MPHSRWYGDDPIMKWQWALVIICGFILGGRLLHVPWKETLATMVFVAFYIEFDVCTRQIEKLMDRVKELEDIMRSMEG